MKLLRASAVLLTMVVGIAALSAQQPPTARPIQSLLGVGNGPAPPPAGADAFFDDSVLQEIRLNMNAKDWQTLKDNYLDNTYYPDRFSLARSDAAKRRHPLARHGQSERREAGTAGGLRSLHVESEFPWPEILRAEKQHAGPIQHARAAEHADVPPPGRAGLARGPREALYQRSVFGSLYDRRVGGQDLSQAKLWRGQRVSVQVRLSDRRHTVSLRRQGIRPGPVRPAAVQTRDPRRQSQARVRRATRANRESIERCHVPFGSRRYLDLSKFLRHVAVEVFVGDYDGFLGNYGINNFYFYRFDNQKTFVFIPWDKSEAFKAGPTSSVFHNISDVPDSLKNRLMTRVLSYPDLYNQYPRLLDRLRAVGGGIDVRRCSRLARARGAAGIQSDSRRRPCGY